MRTIPLMEMKQHKCLKTCLQDRFITTFILLCMLFISSTEAKTIEGDVNSWEAAESNGLFLTEFCFTSSNARIFYKFNTTVKGGKLSLYPSHKWKEISSEADCTLKLSLAGHAVDIIGQARNDTSVTFQEQGRWVLMFTDQNTCTKVIPADDSNYMHYNLELFNPDSHDNLVNHFGCEDKGMLAFFEVSAFLYFILSCICAPSLHETLKKKGPMHEVLSMLTTVLGLQALGVICMFLHLYKYSQNGIGSWLAENVSELLEACAQFEMLYMMLSLVLGWTLGSSKNEINSRVWKSSPLAKVVGVLTVLQGICIILEQLIYSSHSAYHTHQSILGVLALLLRTALACLFAYHLHKVVSKERSILKREFYKNFAKYCLLWFLAYPGLLLVVGVLPEFQQRKCLVMGVIASQTAAVVLLYRLFLSRSLFWELSSLSAASLPLRLDIRNFNKKHAST